MVAGTNSTAEKHSDLATQVSGRTAQSFCVRSTEAAAALFMLMHALKGAGLLECESQNAPWHTRANTHACSGSPPRHSARTHTVGWIEIDKIAF